MSEANKQDNSESLHCSTAIVDVETMNMWFDYWVRLERTGRQSSITPGRLETIEKIRKCALSGVQKNRRTKREVNRLTIERLRGLTESLERQARSENA